MAARTTQQVIASLSISSAPYVSVTQQVVSVLARLAGTVVPPRVRATQQTINPLVRGQPLVARATQIELEVLVRVAGVGVPRLSLLRHPELQFIGVT